MSESTPEFRGDDIVYSLHLTELQLKVTYTALKSYFDDLGHDEHDVREIVGEVLAKLPNEHEIRAIVWPKRPARE